MLIKVLYSLYLLSLGMWGMVSIQFHFIPEILRKHIWYPDKNTPTRTRPESLSSTQPKNILENVSQSQTGFGPVRGNPGFRAALQVFNAPGAIVIP